MEKIESTVLYHCDFNGCNEKSWIGKGHDWKMCEIVFGVHPTTVHKISKESGKSVVVIQKKFHFCREHHGAKELVFRIIAEEFPGPIKNISTKGIIEDGLGCWITIHDCLTPGEHIKNFQLSYDVFMRVYRRFYFSLETKPTPYSSLYRRIETLKELSCQAIL